ncbi:AGAP011049-PA-like protein [Anopheles sinensis]|uniref:AGAP011049-PA-like protein n=1 Tax=Anopheles sinensis TaxID=74873 RepID=A0A084WAD3_ANOSI|nr:AGAP011049-PA-like protein [Anopheles sinensis]
MHYRKDLVNQECRYSAKLEEAEKRVNEANAKVYELQQKLDAVERDALLKEYNVERLQAELVAALKECEGIRARLTTQQSEMEAIRLQASEREDELNLRYQNLEVEHLELNEKLKEVRHLAHDLNSQLIDAKSEVDRLNDERQKLLDARTEEQKIMREALEESIQQRAQVEAKWKHDFEQLRNVNNDREEHLMKDCEFTVRNMQKTCKEKVETADRERKQALEKVGRLEEQTRRQSDEMRHLKSVEAEVEQLRGLTYDQKEALASMTRQVEGLKAELETAYNRLEEEMVKVQQIKNRCEYQLCEKEREALNRIEIARGEIAMQWEDRLLHEMNRLKVELEQMHMEERKSAIEKIQRETLAETEALSQRFNAREQQLKNEIESLKATVEQQKSAMANAQSEADQKLIQSRMYVERAEREHEQKLAKEMDEKNEIIDNLKRQFEQEKLRLEQHFTDRIQQVQEEFAREISDTTEMMKSVHKKELENQWKALVAEKEEALQLMDSRNRNRLEDAENKIRDLTTGHQRQLKDLQDEHSFVVHSLESRDTKNAQEIQTLHKKCRCLTNLFEEMRLRYERRESRPEDLQQIEELKRVIDSQDRDLRLLTETLRELQLEQMQKQRQQPKPQAPQQQQQPPPPPRRSKPNRGKQAKQQQQNNRPQQHKQQQQKNTRPPHPPPEPEPVQPEADAQQEEEECHEVEEVVVGYGQPSAPQVVLIPPPQFIPPGMIHRTMCDVIYEENEADILREEEEAQLNAGEEGEEEVEDSEDEEAGDVQQEDDEETEVLVVDVPESAIQTEDRVIQSTAPTIIEEMDQMPEQRADHFTVVPIETIDDATSARPRASSTPRIVITVDDTEKETDETVVEITEEPSTCVTPVIELPAVFAKIYPSELPPQAAAAGDSGATHSEPEMTVIRTSGEGHGEGSA